MTDRDDPEEFRRARRTPSSTGSPTTAPASRTALCGRRWSRAGCGSGCSRRCPSSRSRSTRCSTSSTGSWCRRHALAVARASSATSRPTPRCTPLLGDMLSGGLGAQGMLWSTSPACTEMEQVPLDELAAALGLDPAEFTFAGGGRRHDRGLRVLGRARRAAGRAAPGATPAWREQRRRRRRARLRHRRDALVAGQGGAGRRAGRAARCVVDAERRRPPAISPDALGRRRWPRTSPPGCGPSWSARRSARPAPAPSTRSGGSPRSRGEHGIWVHVDAAWAGVGGAVPRAPRPARRRRAGRLVLHRRAQVAAHGVRRVVAVGARRRARCPAALSLTPEYLRNARVRLRRGRRLPRLAGAARAPVPRPEAVGR